MAVTVLEKFESRSGDNTSIELAFIISGTDDDVVARTALASEAPGSYAGLSRQEDALHVEPIGPGLWEGKAKYQRTEGSTGTEDTFSFDTAGGTQHITQSIQNQGKHAPAGKTAPDFMGAIGVSHDNVEGVDITVPVFNFTITKNIPAAAMTPQYIQSLYRLTGKVNSGSWAINVDGVQLSFAAGECLFLGASGSKRGSGDWDIGFKFAGSPNATGLTIGGINGIDKKGWEYLWVRYADTEDDNAKAVVKKPIAVYVEKVYEEGDFAQLL